MKDFLEQLNDLIAPITRAWKEVEIITAKIDKGAYSEEGELTLDIRVKLKRGQPVDPVQVSNAKYVRKLYGELTGKQIKTNAIAGEGPKRGVK